MIGEADDSVRIAPVDKEPEEALLRGVGDAAQAVAGRRRELEARVVGQRPPGQGPQPDASAAHASLHEVRLALRGDQLLRPRRLKAQVLSGSGEQAFSGGRAYR